ncbi:MAG: hypothetical protein ACM3W8_05950 [Sideroxydans sp.]|nr:hypothetical protein [Sideroxyarcus sp.]
MECDKKTLVLIDKRHLQAHISPWLFVVLLLAVTVLPFVFLTAALSPDASWVAAVGKSLESLRKIQWSQLNWSKMLSSLAMIGFAFVQIIYLNWARKNERLTLSPDGIRYTSPLPASLKRLQPDWFLPWAGISSIQLDALNDRLINATLVRMTLASSTGQRRISPAVWVDPATYSRPASRLSFTLTPMALQRDEIIREVAASEVMRYISGNAPHIAIASNLDRAERHTSLERNPHGRVAIGIVFLLMLYTFLDFIAGPESYIDPPSSLLHIYIPAGVTGAILAWVWLRRSSLATAEKLGLAMLIGVLVGTAMLPGALRINALTDSSGSRTCDYFVTPGADGVVLRPVSDGLPSIDYFARHPYWDKYSSGELYPVQIHKGILGFYQFNSSVIVDDIHSR